ncbi:protein adenylyltransferase SelO family protein, partial [Stenotrophomonas maltophilia]
SDNINVTGESFDYGPWRFLPRFDPGFTAAYFDTGGLYSFARQPEALFWNLARLADCLVPLCPQERLGA